MTDQITSFSKLSDTLEGLVEFDDTITSILSELGIDQMLASIYIGEFQYVEKENSLYSSGILGYQQKFQLSAFNDVMQISFGDDEGTISTVGYEYLKDDEQWMARLNASPIRLYFAISEIYQASVEDGEITVSENQGLNIDIDADIFLSSSVLISLSDTAFSIGLIRISNSDLYVEVEGCRLIYKQVPQQVLDLGFDQDFIGIYANSITLIWLPQIQMAAQQLPGLRLNFENAAIGNQGVSFDVFINWPVVVTASNQFDSNQTEMLGSIFDNWQIALESKEAVVRNNIPIAFGVNTYLRVPFFDAIFAATFSYSYRSLQDESINEPNYQTALSINKHSNVPIVCSFLNNQLSLVITTFSAQGWLTSSGFKLRGESGFTFDYLGLQLNADSALIVYEHSQLEDFFEFTLTDVVLPEFGMVDEAKLLLKTTRDENDEIVFEQIEVNAFVQWQDISQNIELGQVADLLPLPPDDAEIMLRLSWHQDTLQFALQADLEDVDQLWLFIPQNMRPEVSQASIDILLTKTGIQFEGALSVGMQLRLPELGNIAILQQLGITELITLTSGDDDGWMNLSFTAQIEQTDSGNNGSTNQSGTISAELEHPIAIEMQLPGLQLPNPPVSISIDTISIELGSQVNDVSGVLGLTGAFRFKPVLPENLSGYVPSVMAQQLDQLLSIAKRVELSGAADVTIGISEDNAYFKADCQFDQANLELDLFDMLTGLLGNNPLNDDSSSASEIDLDIDVSIELKQISLALGSEQPSDQEVFPFSFGITTELGFAGQFAELAFELSQENLSIGFNELTIPIAIPKLPLKTDDLDRLNTNGSWDYQQRWLGEIKPELDDEIQRLNQSLQEARDQLELLEQDGQDQQAIFEQKYRLIPSIQQQVFQFAGRKFLYEAILAVHQMLGNVGIEGSQSTYQHGIEIYQAAVDKTIGSLHVDTQMQFKITDAKFVLPFNDPADVRVEGGASIVGFAPDDPLAPLSDLVFKLGLSADAIYFSVEGGVEPIPLPDFGRYPGNAVNFDRLVIGYGYSKNSLLIDFAGELILSDQLISDADTSSSLGAGIKLPSNSKLAFKLDLIPIVLGEVSFLLPLVAFDINLRSEFPPPATSGTCRPVWDGLQIHVPNVLRADLKRYKLSPFFGPIPALNVLCAYDFEIGSQEYGLGIVSDDYFYLAPMLNTIPIPFLADGTPFFNRFCSHIKLGGFELNFDLTRPFPNPSPLLIFELMGFLSDPSIPIDPNGHIANLMYAELHNARISLPPAVQTMFPALSGSVNIDYSGRINVATVISLAQQVDSLAQQIAERLEQTGQQTIDWVAEFTQQPLSFSISDLLDLLPKELRVFELSGRFIHFDASATFVLVQASKLAEFIGSEQPDPLPNLRYELVYENDFSNNDLSDWQTYDFGLKRGTGDWSVIEGRLTQNNNVGDNSPARYGAMLVNTKLSHNNLRLLTKVSSMDNDGIGVVFHLQSKDSFYRFRMTEEQQEWRLTKVLGGEATILHTSFDAFEKNREYQISIEATSEESDHSTHIRIRIDGILWCDVKDENNALSFGYIGVDSWWNNGASFAQIQVFNLVEPNIAIGHEIESSQLHTIANILSPESTSIALEFSDFSYEDVITAMADSDEYAVAVRARVRVFGENIVKMIGMMKSDGHFVLLSSINIKPLTLRVAGISLPLSASVEGRIMLEGASDGAHSFANIRANVFADWVLVGNVNDAENALVRLLVASEDSPASLTIKSYQAFALSGSGELQLFAQQIVISGSIDVSQSHIMIAGSLQFSPSWWLTANTRMLELELSCAGRIGPGHIFELEGKGSLNLLGRTFSDVSATISKQHIELSLAHSLANEAWQLGPFHLKDVYLQLQGAIDFSRHNPSITLSGEGGFEWNKLRFKGLSRIFASQKRWQIENTGSLKWQGKDWLDATLFLSNKGAKLSGRADFGLDLSPSSLPNGINVAGLNVSGAIFGGFDINHQGILTKWDFQFSWQLAIKLPGMQSKQALPIANQLIQVKGEIPSSNNGDLIVLCDLIDFDGITLFDLGDVTVPNIPSVNFNSGQAVYLHDSMTVDADGSNGVSVTVLTPEKPSPTSVPALTIGIGTFGLHFYEVEVGANLPELTLPVPTLSNTPQHPNDPPLFRLPTASTTNVTVEIGEYSLEQASFSLKLVWNKKELGVLVTVANTERFISLSKVNIV